MSNRSKFISSRIAALLTMAAILSVYSQIISFCMGEISSPIVNLVNVFAADDYQLALQSQTIFGTARYYLIGIAGYAMMSYVLLFIGQSIISQIMSSKNQSQISSSWEETSAQ